MVANSLPCTDDSPAHRVLDHFLSLYLDSSRRKSRPQRRDSPFLPAFIWDIRLFAFVFFIQYPLPHGLKTVIIFSLSYSPNQRWWCHFRYLECPWTWISFCHLCYRSLPWTRWASGCSLLIKSNIFINGLLFLLTHSVIGPIVGGFVAQNPRLGWRFNFWLMFIFSTFTLIFGYLVTPETVGFFAFPRLPSCLFYGNSWSTTYILVCSCIITETSPQIASRVRRPCLLHVYPRYQALQILCASST